MALSRGAKVVIVLLVFACCVSIGGMLAIWLMVGAEPTVPAKSTLVVRIDGDPVEGGPTTRSRRCCPCSGRAACGCW